MKYLFAFLFLFSFYTAEAQRGYGNPFGQSGRSRNTPSPGPSQSAAEPEKPDANLISAEKADMYADLLEIDAFSKEVLKNYLKEYYTNLIAIGFDKEMPVENKVKVIEIEKKKLEKSLNDILTEEQVRRIILEEGSGEESKNYKKEKRKKRRRNRNN